MMANRELSLPKFRQDVQAALKHWRDNEAASAIGYLHLFHKIQQEEGGAPKEIACHLLLKALTALEAENPRGAQILRLRFLDNLKVELTAHRLNLEESTIYALQREAIEQLAKRLYQMEEQARAAYRLEMEQRLEAPTYITLVGMTAHLVQLCARLTQPGPPWLIAIEGIGGIGKTALADGVVRQLLAEAAVNSVGWITARRPDFDLGGGLASWQQPGLSSQGLIHKLVEQLAQGDPMITTLPPEKQLTWLQTQLKMHPHLIVIDNLETLLDVECLLPLLRQLSNPTRFLLTSRERLDAEPGLYHFTLPELNETEALFLVRQEAHIGNLPHLAHATDAELYPIYATVGGNPLALRLVIGQTHADNLTLILDDLVQARGVNAEQLYTYIYRRAWEKLDEAARRVWLALPLLTARQATADALVEISGEALPVVRSALAQLVRLNLVYCHGGLNARFYTIHNLTRTFLQQQVGEWL